MRTSIMKSILSCSILTLLISTSTVAYKVTASNVNESNYTRLYGNNRYETAVHVSQKGWSNGADYAVIVSGEEYLDSFCAVPLAKANNAPILLTKKNNIDLETINELKRLQVKHIYLIGSENDISRNVENKLKSEGVSKIERLCGNDRYETSVKIAEKLGATSKAVIVSDKGYADALSVASAAAIEGIPILVTSAGSLPQSVNNYIKSNNITKTYVIGGTASISNSVASLVPGSERIRGANRYETNVNVMNSFLKDFDFNNTYVVSAGADITDGFADSLSGSALAAKTNSPIVLVGSNLENSSENFIKSNIVSSSNITVLASENNIPDSVAEKFGVVSESLNIDYKAYNGNITGNADIVGNNISFKGNVSGNLYIEGNSSSISDTIVNGTIFIDPGKDGVTTLDTVTAKKIVVISGTKEGINFKNIKADTLVIRSKNNVKIILKDKTKISNTIASSQCTLENITGDFGNVTVTGLSIDKPVVFSGGFSRPIVVESSAMVKTSGSTRVPELDINPIGAGKRVILDGTFKNVQVNGNADLVIGTEAKVEDGIYVNSSATVYGEENASINNIAIQPSNKDTIGLSGRFGTTPININTNSQVNLKYGTLIRTIKVYKKALLVYINIPKGAELHEVRGDAFLSGDGSENTIEKPASN